RMTIWAGDGMGRVPLPSSATAGLRAHRSRLSYDVLGIKITIGAAAYGCSNSTRPRFVMNPLVAPFGNSFGPAPSSTVEPGGIGSPRVGRHAGSSYGSMTGPRLSIHSPTVTVPPPVG